MFKKSYLTEYMSTKRNAGIAALKLKDKDSVSTVSFQDDEDIIIITKNGMNIRFKTNDIGAVGRVTMGIKGIKLAENDEVLTALPVHKETDCVGIFTTDGLGKKIAIKDFTIQSRGGKGTILTKKEIAGAAMISDEDNILLTGSNSSICISAKDVPLTSKIAEGNIMIKSNKVISVTKI